MDSTLLKHISLFSTRRVVETQDLIAGGAGGGSTLPNPGGAAQELTLEIEQTWSQEPSGYTRSKHTMILNYIGIFSGLRN